VLGLVILAVQALVWGPRVKNVGPRVNPKTATGPCIPGLEIKIPKMGKSLNRTSAVVAVREPALTGQKIKIAEIAKKCAQTAKMKIDSRGRE